MSQKSSAPVAGPRTAGAKPPAEQVVRDIRRVTRKQHSVEHKIRVMPDGLRGKESITADYVAGPSPCRADRTRHDHKAKGAVWHTGLAAHRNRRPEKMILSLPRRGLVRTLLTTGAAAALSLPAQAQAYPSRPIRLVVPFPPGGGVDGTGRILAEHLAGSLGQPVVIENRAGAGGAIGVDSVAKSEPDGYTIAMVSPGNMTAGPVVRPTPYDPLSLGFITRVVRSPLLLICRKDLEARDLAGFLDLLKRRPDAIRFASGGVGTGTHLAGELLNLRLGVRMVHVPYRGTAPAITDLIAGNVDVFFSDTSAWPVVQQGELRLLAVSSKARWPEAPEVPPVGDAVADFDISNWYGVVAPPGTSETIRDLLAGEIAKVLAKPEVTELLRRLGFQPAPQPPAGFAAFVRTETDTWTAVVRAANIRAD